MDKLLTNTDVFILTPEEAAKKHLQSQKQFAEKNKPFTQTNFSVLQTKMLSRTCYSKTIVRETEYKLHFINKRK